MHFRQFGAGGRTLAERVATRLGYHFADPQLVSAAAKEAGVSEKLVEAASVCAYSGDQDIISGLLLSSSLERGLGLGATGIREGKLCAIFKRLIPEFAARDNVVLLGRGSQFILPDGPNMVKVVLVASHEDRIDFMMNRYNPSETDARRVVNEGEKNRMAFLCRFTAGSPNDPGIYDLSINVSLLSLDLAEELICHLVVEKARRMKG